MDLKSVDFVMESVGCRRLEGGSGRGPSRSPEVFMSSSATALPASQATATSVGFFDAAGVVKKTGSYSRERAVVLLGLSGILVGALVATILVTGALSYVSKAAAGVVFLAACLAAVFLLMPYIDRKFFAMRAAFAFLVTEVIVRGGSNAEGSPSARAQAFLTERFGDLGPVCDAHQDVRRIVVSFFRTFDKIDQLLPIDLGPVRNALAFLVDRISPRIADLAISLAVARGDRDFGEASKDAIAYVAQNPKPLLGTAIRAYITERFLGGTIGFVTMSISFAAVFAAVNAAAGSAAASSGMPSEGATTVGLFAAIFSALLVGVPIGALVSWFVRTAWLEPIALTMLVVRFHSTIAGQPVDPAMRARIATAAGDMKQVGKLAGLFD